MGLKTSFVEAIANIVIKVIDEIGDMNDEQIEKAGYDAGVLYNKNVSDKLPAGQSIETLIEENILDRFLTGFRKGINADEV
jgi:hypothetical protein